MNHNYRDIRSLTDKEPIWFDEHAVPRYCEFTPDEVANIYADEVAFFEIACQECGKLFQVAMSEDQLTRYRRPGGGSLWGDIMCGDLHYGDPPNVNCCVAGATMNSEFKRLISHWRKPPFGDWVQTEFPNKE